jgi:hypothetical protein
MYDIMPQFWLSFQLFRSLPRLKVVLVVLTINLAVCMCNTVRFVPHCKSLPLLSTVNNILCHDDNMSFYLCTPFAPHRQSPFTKSVIMIVLELVILSNFILLGNIFLKEKQDKKIKYFARSRKE